MAIQKPILIGEAAICEYIGISSTQLFKELLKSGLPARQFNGRWYAHVDNINDFFKFFTKKKGKAADPAAE